MLTQMQKKRVRKELDETWDILSTGKRSPRIDTYTGKLIKPTSFLEYDGLYRYATEDMRGYFQCFDKVKRVLTIGGSGDQSLNFINAGAEEVDVFDKNCLSKRGVALKVNAVKTLPREELFSYYRNLSAGIFQKVRPALDEEDKVYWDSLYEITSSSTIRKNFFPYVTLEEQLVKDINPYLDDTIYPKMKDKIENAKINFIDSALYDIEEHIKGRMYDAICLSNVYEYLNGGKSVTREKAQQYYDFVMKTLYPHLNEGGTIVISYLYAFNDKVNEFVRNAYENEPESFLMTLEKNITIDEYFNYHAGLTDQNLSYTFLLDEFAKTDIIKVPTRHVVYGQSFDKSHDMALCLKK